MEYYISYISLQETTHAFIALSVKYSFAGNNVNNYLNLPVSKTVILFAYGLYDRNGNEMNPGSCYTKVFPCSIGGMVTNELKQLLKYNRDKYYLNSFNYRIDSNAFMNALSNFALDRAIEIQYDNENDRHMGGPNFNLRKFNCHKYATSFLLRNGFYNKCLLDTMYPCSSNKMQFSIIRKYDRIVNPVLQNDQGNLSDSIDYKIFETASRVNKNNFYIFDNNLIDHSDQFTEVYESYDSLFNNICKSKKIKSDQLLDQRTLSNNDLLLVLLKTLMEDYCSNWNAVWHWQRTHRDLIKRLLKDINDEVNITDALEKVFQQLPSTLNPRGSLSCRLLYVIEKYKKMTDQTEKVSIKNYYGKLNSLSNNMSSDFNLL